MFEEVTIGECRLILGDCREILPLLPQSDLILTDPPYGIGADKAASKNKGKWGVEVSRRHRLGRYTPSRVVVWVDA